MELKRQLECLAPTREIAEEDVLRLCPKLTSSRKRQRDDRAASRRGDIDSATETNALDSTNSRGVDDTAEEIEQDTGLDPPNTVPVNEDDSAVINTDANDKQPDIDSPSIDAMESVEDNRETHHDEHDINETSPEVLTQDSEDNNTNLEAPGIKESSDGIADAPTLPRKLRRLQKKMNDKRLKGLGKKRMSETSPSDTTHHYPKRSNRNKKLSKYIHASSAASGNMSIKEARGKYPTLYREAMRNELQQLYNKKVIEPIDAPVSGLKHSKIIRKATS